MFMKTIDRKAPNTGKITLSLFRMEREDLNRNVARIPSWMFMKINGRYPPNTGKDVFTVPYRKGGPKSQHRQDTLMDVHENKRSICSEYWQKTL